MNWPFEKMMSHAKFRVSPWAGLLSAEPAHIDDLRRETDLPIALVSSTLALMELKGMVRQVGGMNYVVARESQATYKVD